MLTLSIAVGERVVIGDGELVVERLKGDSIGFTAPDDVSVLREKIYKEIKAGKSSTLSIKSVFDWCKKTAAKAVRENLKT